VLLLLEDFSELELPLGEVSLEAEFDDECSDTTGAATTAGAGTTTIGAGCTITTAGGAGAAVTVSLWWLSEVFSTVSVPAHPITALPNSIATPKENAAVFNRLFMIFKTPRCGSAERKGRLSWRA
jgi:hypothetical protein